MTVLLKLQEPWKADLQLTRGGARHMFMREAHFKIAE